MLHTIYQVARSIEIKSNHDKSVLTTNAHLAWSQAILWGFFEADNTDGKFSKTSAAKAVDRSFCLFSPELVYCFLQFIPSEPWKI